MCRKAGGHGRSGEAKPRELPGSAYGVDAAWGKGHWNVTGEWQRFIMTYRAIPTFTSSASQNTGWRIRRLCGLIPQRSMTIAITAAAKRAMVFPRFGGA